MSARGPKPGAGEVVAWIVQALRAGDKATYEVMMGCPYQLGSVKARLSAMARRGQVGEVEEENAFGKSYKVKRTAPNGRPQQVYTLNKEIEFATSKLLPAKPIRSTAIRSLENAFQGIVTGRVAKAY